VERLVSEPDVELAKLDEHVGAFATRKYVAKLPRRYAIADIDWSGWTPELSRARRREEQARASR